MERRRTERELKVLVVDDEDDLRELLDMSLARMGLHASLAGSVGEARELLGKERFALCLTDMRLPDGEGMELVRHIAEHHRDLPVAVITAFGSMDNAVAALKAGAMGASISGAGPSVFAWFEARDAAVAAAAAMVAAFAAAGLGSDPHVSPVAGPRAEVLP